jgi:hypothetical protein
MVKDLFSAQHSRELFLSSGPDKGESGPIPFEGVLIEELDTADGDGAGASGPFLDILAVEEIVTEFLLCDEVGGFIVMLGELTNGPDIHLLSPLAITF